MACIVEDLAVMKNASLRLQFFAIVCAGVALGFARRADTASTVGRLGTPLRGLTKSGYSVNGGFAEYALTKAKYAGHLPNDFGLIEISPVFAQV